MMSVPASRTRPMRTSSARRERIGAARLVRLVTCCASGTSAWSGPVGPYIAQHVRDFLLACGHSGPPFCRMASPALATRHRCGTRCPHQPQTHRDGDVIEDPRSRAPLLRIGISIFPEGRVESGSLHLLRLFHDGTRTGTWELPGTATEVGARWGSRSVVRRPTSCDSCGTALWLPRQLLLLADQVGLGSPTLFVGEALAPEPDRECACCERLPRPTSFRRT